ncbi:C1 [Bhendi yellow vein India betasatellite]|uniref:C1 n=1 Tax=Bhendi yellow vein mosaic betasatellite TaxID=908070 RepID=A0A0M4ARD5_9VIRU|nr:C1 protein [Bhendi yellow vein India betasatellite [India:Pandarahalli:OY168:2006]]ALB26222.1 C1 [Bhendi yellow vein India betasatellite]ALB26236.1 C1 [Bhendi yellow vein mosaic betasatellite]
MKISSPFIHTLCENINQGLFETGEHSTVRNRKTCKDGAEGMRETRVFKVDVRPMQQQRISVHMQISSTKSAAISTKTFIIDYTYPQFHIPFDFSGLEGTITSTCKFHYWGSKAEGILVEDIIHMEDITIIGNPDIMGMDVNEPVTIDNEIII